MAYKPPPFTKFTSWEDEFEEYSKNKELNKKYQKQRERNPKLAIVPVRPTNPQIPYLITQTNGDPNPYWVIQESNWNNGGIVILRTASKQEAEDLIFRKKHEVLQHELF